MAELLSVSLESKCWGWIKATLSLEGQFMLSMARRINSFVSNFWYEYTDNRSCTFFKMNICGYLPILVLKPLSWWDGSLHYEDSPCPLPHPLILYLCNLATHEALPHTVHSHLGIGISHHGYQQVKQQDHQQGNEEEPVYLAWNISSTNIINPAWAVHTPINSWWVFGISSQISAKPPRVMMNIWKHQKENLSE